MEAAHLVVIGDLHNINPRVDIEVTQEECPGLSRLQGAQWTLAVVSQPGEWVQTVAATLPLHFHHPLLIQSPDMPR